MHLNRLQVLKFKPFISTLKVQAIIHCTILSTNDKFYHYMIMNIVFLSNLCGLTYLFYL
jgi:hypothetical protein